MDGLAELVLLHQERAVVRIGDVFLKSDVEIARLDREIAALRGCPVPAPTVLWTHDGPPRIVALSRVEGRPLSMLGSETPFGPEVWRAAGALARRIHDAPAPSGVPHWFDWPNQVPQWIDGERDWLLDDGRVDRGVVEAHADFAHRHLDGRAAAPRFIHGDLQCEHILVGDDGVITGVIDWGDTGIGDPLYDLAVLTVGYTELVDDVLAGYASDVDRDVLRAYWSLRRLGSVHWRVEHGFPFADDVAALEVTAP